MWSGVNLTATIGIAVNLAFLYLLIRNKRVRELSVHGLLMLSATNDVMLNLFSLSGFPTTIRYWMGWYASFRQCTFELSREFYLVTPTQNVENELIHFNSCLFRNAGSQIDTAIVDYRSSLFNKISNKVSKPKSCPLCRNNSFYCLCTVRSTFRLQKTSQEIVTHDVHFNKYLQQLRVADDCPS